MQRRNKILVIALVICLGSASAYFFRKRGPSSADVLNTPQLEEQALTPPRAGPDKPAPQSHLLGEIQTADSSPSDSQLTPVAPATAAGSTVGAPVDRGASSPISVGHAPLTPAYGQTPDTGALPLGAASPGAALPSAGPADASLTPVAPASTPAFADFAPSGAPQESMRHRVVDGDTLTGLAERYLGAANRFLEIYDLNRDKMTDPDLLPIGAELRIPSRGLRVAPPVSHDPQPMVPLSPSGLSDQSADLRSGRVYRVRRNDTLSGIAKQVYGDTSRSADLLEANRQQLSRPEDLKAGSLLIVP